MKVSNDDYLESLYADFTSKCACEIVTEGECPNCQEAFMVAQVKKELTVLRARVEELEGVVAASRPVIAAARKFDPLSWEEEEWLAFKPHERGDECADAIQEYDEKIRRTQGG
jgi:hypothetical protein